MLPREDSRRCTTGVQGWRMSGRTREETEDGAAREPRGTRAGRLAMSPDDARAPDVASHGRRVTPGG